MLPEIPRKRHLRLDVWRKLSPNIIEKLPERDLAYMKAAIEKSAKLELAKSQIAKYDSIRSHRLGGNQRQITQIIVILTGALTFATVPQLLAKQAGRGALSISAGLIGGAVATFFAHENATKVLAGIKLKNQTKSSRKAF